MTIQKFIARLNWRQVLIHFIATWFFMYSFQTLAVLHNTNLIDILRHSDKGDLSEALSKKQVSATEVSYFVMWTSLSNTFGSLVAFIISLAISIKRKWFWFNSIIVFVLVFILSRYEQLGWNFLKNIFLTPGEIFGNIILEYLANGIILLTLGLLTFFSGKANKFIAPGKTVAV
ncbi:hypothetical protein [Ferruginibacter sp. SUN106]|uniref:hypothetical protein n=1 Tax=Ferruginibacter sp. SUN106 TaxID=2978348 RepID=UPI003D35A8FF